MAVDKLILAIGHGRIDGARVRGRHIIGSHRIETPDLRHEQVWDGDLCEYEEPISQIMRAVGVSAGASVTVSYTSPRTTVEAIAVPAIGETANRSMRISLGEVTGTALTHCAVGYQKLWASRTPQRHTLGLWVAESDSAVSKLCTMLSRVGLRAERLVPANAVSLYSCWLCAHALNEPDVIVIDVDEQITTMCGMVDGTPRLVRQVTLGTDLLVDAYARAMRAARATDGFAPSREEAAHSLWTYGVPGRDDVVDRSGAIRGHHVLPLIQSVVQRLAIEIKQTVRFGLDLDSRRVRVRMSGPGAMVPSLASLLSDHADAQLETTGVLDGSERVWNPDAVIRRVLSGMPPGINLLPKEVLRRGAAGTIRRAALVGAGVAAIVIATDIGVKGQRLAGLESALSDVKPEVETLREQLAIRAGAAQLSQAVMETERRLQLAMGATADWHAALAVVREVGDHGISLSDVACAYEAGQPVMTIRGTTHASDQKRDRLRELVSTLSSRPEFEAVSVESVRLQQVRGESTRSFTISMRIRPTQTLASETGDER